MIANNDRVYNKWKIYMTSLDTGFFKTKIDETHVLPHQLFHSFVWSNVLCFPYLNKVVIEYLLCVEFVKDCSALLTIWLVSLNKV